MSVNEALREAIARDENGDQLKALARKHGMRTLFQDALEKVIDGTTSMKEALGAARPDDE
jgi:general secretion pathway protein E